MLKKRKAVLIPLIHVAGDLPMRLVLFFFVSVFLLNTEDSFFSLPALSPARLQLPSYSLMKGSLSKGNVIIQITAHWRVNLIPMTNCIAGKFNQMRTDIEASPVESCAPLELAKPGFSLQQQVQPLHLCASLEPHLTHESCEEEGGDEASCHLESNVI